MAWSSVRPCASLRTFRRLILKSPTIAWRYSWKPDAFKVDTQGVLFHTVGPRSPELVIKNNRLVNPSTGKSPSFVHGPNKGDLSKVEQWVNALN